MPWTQEQLYELKRLTRTLTLKQIAETLGRSEHEVRHQIRKQRLHTLSPHVRSLKDAEKIFRFSQEHGCKKTALNFGLSVSIVKNIRRTFSKRIARRNKTFSGERLYSYWKMAHAHAIANGYGSHAQDFASFVILQRIQNPERSIYLQNIFIDYKAQEFGNPRSEDGQAKLDGIKRTDIIGTQHLDGSIVDPPDTRNHRKSERLFILADSLNLTEKERICFLLFSHVGMTYLEIGRIIGVKRIVIEQIMSEVFEKIKKSTIQLDD